MRLAERLKPGIFMRTGHRGAAHLAPENTLESIQKAIDIGVDLVEIDVQSTADGRIVLMHDDTVNRTTDGKGAVSRLTFAQLAKFDAGFRFVKPHHLRKAHHPWRGKGVRVPLLEDVLTSFPDAGFTIEIKTSPHRDFVRNFIAILDAYGRDRVIVASDALPPLRAVRTRLPHVLTNCARPEIQRFYFLCKLGLSRIARIRGNVLQVPIFAGGDRRAGPRVVTRDFVRSAHLSGKPVQVWTVNKAAEMKSLIELGVDGITTDRPDVLNQVIARMEDARKT